MSVRKTRDDDDSNRDHPSKRLRDTTGDAVPMAPSAQLFAPPPPSTASLASHKLTEAEFNAIPDAPMGKKGDAEDDVENVDSDSDYEEAAGNRNTRSRKKATRVDMELVMAMRLKEQGINVLDDDDDDDSDPVQQVIDEAEEKGDDDEDDEDKMRVKLMNRELKKRQKSEASRAGGGPAFTHSVDKLMAVGKQSQAEALQKENEERWRRTRELMEAKSDGPLTLFSLRGKHDAQTGQFQEYDDVSKQDIKEDAFLGLLFTGDAEDEAAMAAADEMERERNRRENDDDDDDDDDDNLVKKSSRSKLTKGIRSTITRTNNSNNNNNNNSSSSSNGTAMTDGKEDGSSNNINNNNINNINNININRPSQSLVAKALARDAQRWENMSEKNEIINAKSSALLLINILNNGETPKEGMERLREVKKTGPRIIQKNVRKSQLIQQQQQQQHSSSSSDSKNSNNNNNNNNNNSDNKKMFDALLDAVDKLTALGDLDVITRKKEDIAKKYAIAIGQ